MRGALWHQPRRVTVQVRVSERPCKDQPGSSDGSQTDAAARKLTSKIKQAKSAAELFSILAGEMHSPIFNTFHVSAAYHSLATWERKGELTPSDKASGMLYSLGLHVLDMAEEGQLDFQAMAIVLELSGEVVQ